MMNTMPTFLRKAFEIADKYDVDLPHRAQLEERLMFITTVDNWTPTDVLTINKAIVLALDAGRDPLDDPQVQRSVLAERVREGAHARTDEARMILAQEVTAATDDMIEAFKPVYDAAGARFLAAHKTLTDAGITTLDSQGASQGSLEIAKANIEARETDVITRETSEAISVLVFSATGTSLEADRWNSVFYRYDVGDTALDRIARNGDGKLKNWQAADQGYTFSLAASEERQQRRQAATQRQQARVAAEDLARRDSVRTFPPMAIK